MYKVEFGKPSYRRLWYDGRSVYIYEGVGVVASVQSDIGRFDTDVGINIGLFWAVLGLDKVTLGAFVCLLPFSLSISK